MNNYQLQTVNAPPPEVSSWLSHTPFHSEQWSKLIHDILGIQTLHTIVVDGDKLVGYLPYYLGGVFNNRNRSGPAAANYCPAVIFDENIQRESAPLHQILSTRHPDTPLKSADGNKSSTSIFTIDIAGTFENYWTERVHAKARYDVRKAEKHAIRTEFLGSQACDIFYLLYIKRMRELGSPALPKIFFQLLAEYFEGDFHFAVSFKGNEPVAASTLLSDNNHWLGHPWSVSDSAFRSISVNYLHYRDLIKYAFEQKFSQFYLGPSLKNSNWSRIKLRFGGEESFVVRLDGKPNVHAADSALVQLAQFVISHLPAAVYKRASPAIAKIALKLIA